MMVQIIFVGLKIVQGFVAIQLDIKKGGKSQFCHYCLQGFASAEKMKNHILNGCADITTCKPCMPISEEALVKLKIFDK